ncbi:MAG TPA: L-threonylcarbamoyladenylate synthase [Candidatus Limnocylindrales bacterium]|nr:L-threonylcarbamoyladenylate synthase [Candidatus Limnocylindrales bacterium]
MSARWPADPPHVEAAAARLRAGGVIAFPTETVYGVGALAGDPGAVSRLYAIKRRPGSQPMILLVRDAAQVEALAVADERARRLMRRFWPGALTIVLPRRPGMRTPAALGETLAFRAPGHPVVLDLLQCLGEPLASSSANRAGDPPPLDAVAALAALGDDVDLVLDGGAVTIGRPSTIVDLSGPSMRILRQGSITEAEVRHVIMDTVLQARDLTSKIDAVDPEVGAAIRDEFERQQYTLELIPSENIASPAVLQALGSLLNNKYAEGYPGKRYYGGCGNVDRIESLAIERAKALFGAEHANVQSHCGTTANYAVYAAVLKPGDTVLGMDLSHGGHLSHGSPVNFSGKLYHFVSYGVDRETERIDYDALDRQAREVSPKMLLAGYSAYPRVLDFERLAAIARAVDAYFFVDMAHFAGLVAGGAHPSPVPHADFVSFTTHKTMRGPWGAMILCKATYAAEIDKSVFPGSQGGPQNHAVAAKAVMLAQWKTPEFRSYAQRVVANARVLAEELQRRGLRLVSGGTDNHLMLIDLRPLKLTGRKVQETFDTVGVTVNRNAIPFDEASKFNPSGIRLGTPSVTTRGMGEGEMRQIADMVATLLEHLDDAAVHQQIRARSRALCERFPLPY